MTKKNSLNNSESSLSTSYKITEGSVSFSAPSNIALIKYWGKEKIQIPKNASLSFTLNNCNTETSVSFSKKDKKNNDFSFQFIFEGKPKPSFEPKIKIFLERIEPYCSFLKDFHFQIESINTFPHSSGIASSASAMSALARCFVEIEKELGTPIDVQNTNKKASFLARLGSGSACRSVEGPITVWGKSPEIKGSSDEYAVKFSEKIDPIFNNYQDTVLLIDKGEKQVSSTVGHNLMHNHPFAENRFKQANNNLAALKKAISAGNMEEFISIVESEALSLHAMMMTSSPYFILIKPDTLKVINAIWEYRKTTKVPVCFTLDAGANVHVLYPKQHSSEVLTLINEQLAQYCQDSQYICDHIGTGVKKL